MIVVHVLGLLYGFGVMVRHLVGNIMSLEAYSARWEQSIEYLIRPFWAITFDATNLLLFTGRLCAGGSWKQMDYVRAHQINMQLLTAVAVVEGWITVFAHMRFLWELTLITKMSVQLGGSFAFLYAAGFVDVWTTQMRKACSAIASCFMHNDKMSNTLAADLNPQNKEI